MKRSHVPEMSPPTVRVNTFVQKIKQSNSDGVTKMFIILELIFGINRVPVVGKIKPLCIPLSLAFTVSINTLVIYLTFSRFSKGLGILVKVLKLGQYIMCAILGFAFRKKLCDFFSELTKFDKKTGFRKTNKDINKNVRRLLITFGFIIAYMIFMPVVFKDYNVELVVILLTNFLELHFFGHLISLLVPRLCFISRLMKKSLCNGFTIMTVQSEVSAKDTKYSPIDMKKLMDYYHRLIITYDILYGVIKWPMIIIFISSFISSLAVSYTITLGYIRNDYVVLRLLVEATMGTSELIPMFAPCRMVDAVHGEVRCLIELLSSKLYENKIEKSSRPAAQALLALMEARDLSFSLLCIFDIDVSFPFKFLGLLITYLIILLQFEKIISIERPQF